MASRQSALDEIDIPPAHFTGKTIAWPPDTWGVWKKMFNVVPSQSDNNIIPAASNACFIISARWLRRVSSDFHFQKYNGRTSRQNSRNNSPEMTETRNFFDEHSSHSTDALHLHRRQKFEECPGDN